MASVHDASKTRGADASRHAVKCIEDSFLTGFVELACLETVLHHSGAEVCIYTGSTLASSYLDASTMISSSGRYI
eukprot:scaffold316500_cov26-Prasinocladus_malaysianus.AAC.1